MHQWMQTCRIVRRCKCALKIARALLFFGLFSFRDRHVDAGAGADGPRRELRWGQAVPPALHQVASLIYPRALFCTKTSWVRFVQTLLR
jgi:hypothetical protein